MKYTITIPDGYIKQPLPGKTEWGAALRSGKYKQGWTKLKAGDSYCCLGVKCELDGRPTQVGRPYLAKLVTEFDGLDAAVSAKNPLFSYLHGLGSFPGGVHVNFANDANEETGVSASDLAACNDRGLSFAQIADIIDEVWRDK